MSREYFDRAMIPGTRDESTQIIRHYACSGSCNQGRSKCPTPEACEVPDDADPVASAIFWRLYALALLLVALLAVVVIVAK